MLSKTQIASNLREIGQLLNLQGENKFRAKAYLDAARTVTRTSEDIAKLVKEDALDELPRVGESIALVIKELCTKGESRLLTHLRSGLPPGTSELASVKGLTLKRIQTLHSKLQISSVSQLREACKNNEVAALKGFNSKIQQQILNTIESSGAEEQIRLFAAFEISDDLIAHLKAALGTEAVHIAGTVRRWHETISIITLVTAAQTSLVREALIGYPDVIAIDSKKDRQILHFGNGLTAHIISVADIALGLLVYTGSLKHFELLQAAAKEKDLSLTERGLKEGKHFVKATTEQQLFRKLGLAYIPPELREGENEVKLAKDGGFDSLIEIDDIVGMTHCHTTYSDGINSIAQMAQAAQKMGMEYITITDHSPTAHYAGGLELDRLKQQWEEIDQVQETLKIKILKGTECDILADGKLDYPDKILDRFDVIIASIHSRYKQDEEAMTRRLLTALQNPRFKIWGHPLGRLVLSRDPIPCNVEEVLEAIAQSRVAIEINADPYRLDLAPQWCKVAKRVGLKFVISTDAHGTGALHNLRFGVHMARRAGLEKADILNARPLNKFLKCVQN